RGEHEVRFQRIGLQRLLCIELSEFQIAAIESQLRDFDGNEIYELWRAPHGCSIRLERFVGAAEPSKIVRELHVHVDEVRVLAQDVATEVHGLAVAALRVEHECVLDSREYANVIARISQRTR